MSVYTYQIDFFKMLNETFFFVLDVCIWKWFEREIGRKWKVAEKKEKNVLSGERKGYKWTK